MIVDSKLLNLSSRLYQLTQRREQIDAEIAQALSELVSYCRSTEQPSAVPIGGNGSGTSLTLAPEIVAPKLPPSDSLQGKVLTWLKTRDQPQVSTAIATGVGHPHEATKSTLNAMRGKGLVRKAGRDLWAAAA